MVTKIVISVNYLQIDSMGIVHHSNYPIWFELARKDYFKKSGVPKSKIVAHGFFLPLSEMNCEFKCPAKYDDEIIVTAEIVYMSCVKVKFEYKVKNKKNDKLLAVGKTVHAWTDKSIKPINMEKAAPEVYGQLKQFAEAPGIS